MLGFRTLLYKEVLRFWKVSFQTVAAPVLTAMLYLMIFSHVLEAHVQVHGVPYPAFLIPGLVMMSALQNAFANSSSSLIQAKVTGSVVFVLLPPISYVEFFLAYVVAAMLRGLMVGAGVLLVHHLVCRSRPAGPAMDSDCSSFSVAASWERWEWSPASGPTSSTNWPVSRTF
jgi:ABC-2 type transport system permease protein